MAYLAYPADTDLYNFLQAAQIITGAPAMPLGGPIALMLQAAVGAAIQDWEDSTGFQPFLSSGADSVRLFTPDGVIEGGGLYSGFWSGIGYGGDRTLDLRGGLVSLTSVYVGYDALNPTTASPMTLNRDVFLEPANAAARKKPYTSLRWAGLPRQGAIYSIQVTGQWGFCTPTPNLSCSGIPADVWLCLLRTASLNVAAELAQLLAPAGITSQQDEDNKVQYNRAPLRDQAETWEKYRRDVLMRYMRVM